MKKTGASWDVGLTVDCPYCKEYQGDILDKYDEWWDVFGEPGSSEKLYCEQEYECEDCGKTFIIDETYF